MPKARSQQADVKTHESMVGNPLHREKENCDRMSSDKRIDPHSSECRCNLCVVRGNSERRLKILRNETTHKTADLERAEPGRGPPQIGGIKLLLASESQLGQRKPLGMERDSAVGGGDGTKQGTLGRLTGP